MMLQGVALSQHPAPAAAGPAQEKLKKGLHPEHYFARSSFSLAIFASSDFGYSSVSFL